MSRKIIRSVSLLALAALSVPLLSGASRPAGDLSLIYGIYDLQEWHTEGGVLKPPQIYGHFVVRNGTITTVLHNGVDPGYTTIAGIGHYTLQNGKFAYQYDHSETFSKKGGTITVDGDLPWKGLKVFDVIEQTPTSLKIRTADGDTEFDFTPTSFAAFDHGKPLRSYKRLAK